MSETNDNTGAPTEAPRLVLRKGGLDAYEAVIAIFALLGGAASLLAGIAVTIALLLGLSSRAGVELPGALGNPAWLGYLVAWLAAFTFTPFGAIAGAISGGRWGRLAGKCGIAWCVGLLVMTIAPLLAGVTAGRSGGILAIGPTTGAFDIAFFAVTVAVMAVLPTIIGAAALASGLGRVATTPTAEG